MHKDTDPETNFEWVGDLKTGYPVANRFFEIKTSPEEVQRWEASLGLQGADRTPAHSGFRVVGIVTSPQAIESVREKLFTITTRKRK